MVKRSTSTQPVPASSIPLRRFSSLPLIALLYTSATPFTPFYWLLSIDGTLLFDRLLSGAILLSALYFQYQITIVTSPLAIILPTNPGQSDHKIRNSQATTSSKNDEIVLLYKPELYWYFVAAEAVLLCFAEWSGFEYLRRGIVVAVVGALWGVGWFCTPDAYKRWAWGHLKAI